ncbi:hypothetical protein QQS21_000595 [Conoideocrella luteorostrata]|uniref:Uncharacterized protein n=1 Tax=Conoideocrella luteorostrata TaxID=1105319 RepID=A0AAJ0G2H7_9HYPO|nr:hypothetical protein QQS21_000595 [Conoideocrella luteorostrata]
MSEYPTTILGLSRILASREGAAANGADNGRNIRIQERRTNVGKTERRFAIDDWVPEPGVKKTRTLYPKPDSTAVARDMAAGNMLLSRADRETNAIVAPGFKGLASTGDAILTGGQKAEAMNGYPK